MCKHAYVAILQWRLHFSAFHACGGLSRFKNATNTEAIHLDEVTNYQKVLKLIFYQHGRLKSLRFGDQVTESNKIYDYDWLLGEDSIRSWYDLLLQKSDSYGESKNLRGAMPTSNSAAYATTGTNKIMLKPLEQLALVLCSLFSGTWIL